MSSTGESYFFEFDNELMLTRSLTEVNDPFAGKPVLGHTRGITYDKKARFQSKLKKAPPADTAISIPILLDITPTEGILDQKYEAYGSDTSSEYYDTASEGCSGGDFEHFKLIDTEPLEPPSDLPREFQLDKEKLRTLLGTEESTSNENVVNLHLSKTYTIFTHGIEEPPPNPNLPHIEEVVRDSSPTPIPNKSNEFRSSSPTRPQPETFKICHGVGQPDKIKTMIERLTCRARQYHNQPIQMPGFTSYHPSETLTNRPMIINSVKLTLFCAPGSTRMKDDTLSAVQTSSANHLLLLLRYTVACTFKGLYYFNLETKSLIKIMGMGPDAISNDTQIEKFMKYNSAQRIFVELQTTHLTVTTDAFTIRDSYWTTNASRPKQKKKCK